MRRESGRGIRGLVILIMVAFLVCGGSIYLGNVTLSHQVIALSLVCLASYVIYEFVIVKLLYRKVHLYRMRAAPDSLDLRKQVWGDIALFERRAGMVVLVILLVFVGSIIKGFAGITVSLLVALAIVLYARRIRII